MSVRILTGDCRTTLATLDAGSVHAVVTSPPYAEQRRKQYGGVSEKEYPSWTVEWMGALRPALAPGASVLVNIREHVKDGQISDYVHRTRLAVRDAGWIECDELIWIKPDAPPVGHPRRPRRSWERVLWFALDAGVRCFPQANGQQSERLGLVSGGASTEWLAQSQGEVRAGVSRCRDWFAVGARANPNGIAHPAVFPPRVAEWLIRLVTLPGEVVLDPFGGAGTTGLVADRLGRDAILCELNPAYADLARERITADAPLFANPAA